MFESRRPDQYREANLRMMNGAAPSRILIAPGPALTRLRGWLRGARPRAAAGSIMVQARPSNGAPRMRAALLALLLLAVALGFAAKPAPARTPSIHSYAIVQNDGTLRVQGKTIRLFGLYIPSSARGCVTILRPVRCGSRAVRALELKIQGFVECLPQRRHRDGSISAVCYVKDSSILDPPVDLGAWLIEQGFAVAGPGAPFEYGVLEDIARVNRRGLWGFQVDRIRLAAGARSPARRATVPRARRAPPAGRPAARARTDVTMTLEALLALLLAPLVGSFLGVVVERLPEGRPIALARSTCPACGAVLRARDLVPLVSWTWRRGWCRCGRFRLGAFYPGIELAALAVAASAAHVLSGWLLWASLALGWTLLTLAAIDLRHYLLPDRLTLPLIPAGLATAYLIDPAKLPRPRHRRRGRLHRVRRHRLGLSPGAPARGPGAGRRQASGRRRRLARLAGAARPGRGRRRPGARGRLGPGGDSASGWPPPRASRSGPTSRSRSGCSGCTGRSSSANRKACRCRIERDRGTHRAVGRAPFGLSDRAPTRYFRPRTAAGDGPETADRRIGRRRGRS